MFRRRSKPGTPAAAAGDGAAAYHGLRDQVLDLDPADGTTSMYTSTGGGIIGGGSHQAVVSATRAFLACIEEHLRELPADAGTGLPGRGRVIIRALTYQGQQSAEASEDDLGYGRHALSPVFHAGHEVITRLRLLDEARADPGRGSQQPPSSNEPEEGRGGRDG